MMLSCSKNNLKNNKVHHRTKLHLLILSKLHLNNGMHIANYPNKNKYPR